MKVGDFVQVPTPAGKEPKFGFIRAEGYVSKYNIPVWIIQTDVRCKEAIPKSVPIRKYPS